jgi:hypothetical protein
MKWVKIDAAPVGLKYRISKQVIQVYEHGCQQDEVCSFPVVSEKSKCNDKWKHQV